ncbi:hypothetical protein A2924_00795 [Candidatus Giovannonibacteria bacterium RIFCSPLOWO2_01_FULL_44_16]|uniref:Uncharacterized protein n=1 Tax=Candidatus Giovannonibacteria bacterium RIFCSPLOWO2_01_FULL_44_16 TaxID=1798348 RepID=A0A1F5X485_9BACT|nr:MAG: hypothetical protein A2924_00795 [Candidatus Giovannonibacteria bacterium RIFCSPLOWO2_01_FULL_44_16]
MLPDHFAQLNEAIESQCDKELQNARIYRNRIIEANRLLVEREHKFSLQNAKNLLKNLMD